MQSRMKAHIIYGSIIAALLGSHAYHFLRGRSDDPARRPNLAASSANWLEQRVPPEPQVFVGVPGETSAAAGARVSTKPPTGKNRKNSNDDQAGPRDDGGGAAIGFYTEEDFKHIHGIESEAVDIPALPMTLEQRADFLTGTFWGWGSNPEHDVEYIVFLDDKTLFGSWGKRYEYTVDPDTSEIVWQYHRTSFTENMRYLKSAGRYPRVGNLLKQADGDLLAEIREMAAAAPLVEFKEDDK